MKPNWFKALAVLLMLSTSSCSFMWHSIRGNRGEGVMEFADDYHYHSDCRLVWFPMMMDAAGMTGFGYLAWDSLTDQELNSTTRAINIGVMYTTVTLMTLSFMLGLFMYPGCENE